MTVREAMAWVMRAVDVERDVASVGADAGNTEAETTKHTKHTKREKKRRVILTFR